MTNEYTTKDGHPITFTVYENDPKDSINRMDDRGWVLHRIVAEVDGREAGFIKVSYIPSADFKRIYPTPLHYKAKSGWVSVDNALASGDLNLIWLEANRYLRYRGEVAPPPAQRDLELKEISKRFKNEWQQFKKFHVDRPIVDYIKVEDAWKRQGIATALYQFAAKWLAKKGLALHASGLQQPEAAAAWKKMKSDPQLPISDVPHPYDKEKRRTVLDYRKMTQNVASRHQAREVSPSKSDILRRMKTPSEWVGSGHVRVFDVPFEDNPMRYSLVSDAGDWYAAVQKGKGQGSRLFIEPGGEQVAPTLATPYGTEREALAAVMGHAQEAMQRYGLPEESLWSRWFGRSASLVAARHIGANLATPKQVDYALALIRKIGQGWHDTDAGQFGGPPNRQALEKYTSREISDLISDLRN